MRWFHCMGRSEGCHRAFHNESYLEKGDTSIFEKEYTNHVFLDDFNGLELFGFNFDNGSALVEELEVLFKIAKYSYMQLECEARSHVNNLGISTMNRKINNSLSYRKGIVRFLLYLRNHIRRIGSYSQFEWLRKNLFEKVKEELNGYMSFCGPITDLPDYIINYPANSIGNKCTQPSYHIFHCHLDMKWLHITSLYVLIILGRRDTQTACTQNDTSLTLEVFQQTISNVLLELLIMALKRFNNIPIVDLNTTTMFTCTCVRELWKLLQICCDKLHSQQLCAPFWQYVNRICEEIMENNLQGTVESVDLKVTNKCSCTSPTAFVIWILKDLTDVYNLGTYTDVKTNYNLLERSLKLFLNAGAPELEMRIVLLLNEHILNNGWEERTEPLVLFWDYFYKRMNSTFFLSSAPISGMPIIGRSASGILRNLTNKLDPLNNEKNMDSFNVFLRILGIKMKKWQTSSDGLRYWYQLKGRLLSKFSASKLSTLNETGLYHFILLFLTLAMTADLEEMGSKLQMFLQLLRIEELDEARVKLIMQAHMALILLFVERNRNFGAISNVLLDAVEVIQHRPDNLSLMRVYIDGFHDLINCTDNLELGQNTLMGNWILRFLSSCTESDANHLLHSMHLLATKLETAMSKSVQVRVKQDRPSQFMLLENTLWEYLVPYLKITCISSTSLYQVSEITAIITTLSLKSSILPNNKTRAVELIAFFVTHESADAIVLCRYLGQICRSECLYNSFNKYNTIFIKGWLRCLISLGGNEDQNEHLSYLSCYISSSPEMQHILNKFSSVSLCREDYFENFLLALQSKYDSFEDSHSKNKFLNQISNYFLSTDKWIAYTLKFPKSANQMTNIYRNVGYMFTKIPRILYTKSKSNSLLQYFVNLLLLPIQFRNPQITLHRYVSEAIKKTLYLYVDGLFTLDPENDIYISRCIRELITTFVPRFVSSKENSFSRERKEMFFLIECFENSERFDLVSKTIFDIVCFSFLKKRARAPHQFAFQALTFLLNLTKHYKTNHQFIKNIITNAFDRICDVMMFCDPTNPCRTEARDAIFFILNLNPMRTNTILGDEITNAFARLCHEHLAFTSRHLFDLFEDITNVAPDLIFRFLPQLKCEIKEVENKRGVGYDQALRKGLERIENALQDIRNNPQNNHFL